MSCRLNLVDIKKQTDKFEAAVRLKEHLTAIS